MQETKTAAGAKKDQSLEELLEIDNASDGVPKVPAVLGNFKIRSRQNTSDSAWLRAVLLLKNDGFDR